jgi:hypothetical protein
MSRPERCAWFNRRLAASAAVCTALALLALSGRLGAHDLPADVTLVIWAKPEGARLRVILRAPLAAMGDVDYPTRGPGGLLDLANVAPALREAVALWLIPSVTFAENDRILDPPRLVSIRLSLPSDRSFETFDGALAHVLGDPLPSDTDVFWPQGTLDALLDYDIRSDRSALALEPRFARLGVRVVTGLRFLTPDGGVRAFEFAGDPGLIRLDPRWDQALTRFVALGLAHILGGADHLLFLVCLVIPLRRFLALLPVVTAFAIAHSITLVGSAFGIGSSAIWFPPLVETLIAASIVYMALENMLAVQFSHRWVVAFVFGLVHGFGFSFALRESMQFAGTHLLTSLLAFNAGVELGQILVLAVLLPPLVLLLRLASSERATTIVLSALVLHTAWHWMVERGALLTEFRFEWPRIDAAFGASTAGALLLLAIAGACLWLLSIAIARLAPTTAQRRPPRSEP